MKSGTTKKKTKPSSAGKKKPPTRPIIGGLNEKPLHAALKEWCARPGDRIEAPFGGFVVDIVRPLSKRPRRDLAIEIQTRNFSSLKRKLQELCDIGPTRLVHPIARDRWIVRLKGKGPEQLGRRKSPKHGVIEDIFEELVHIPRLIANPSFSFEALFIQEEEVRRYAGPNRAWRRKGWVTEERRLLDVLDGAVFESPSDFASLLPSGLFDPFTTADLAKKSCISRRLAQKMVYCLREMKVIVSVGKQGNSIQYCRL